MVHKTRIKGFQSLSNYPVQKIEVFPKVWAGSLRLKKGGGCRSIKKILSDTSKLSGNVIYGVTITNKEKFTNLKYTSSAQKASRYVNSNKFIGIEELAEDVYEIQLAKSKIEVNTPIAVGFAILQYAKLRMLEFKYDFMDKFFDDRTFQYVTMDTDSAYFATSARLEQMVKSEEG